MVTEQLIVKSGHKQTEVGFVPEEWYLVKLDKICSKIGDGIHKTPKYVNYSNIFFINGNNLVNGSIKISDNTKCINESELKKHKKDLEENTILMSINGTIGNLALYKNEKIVLGKSVSYIQLKKSMETKFIFYLLQTPTVKNFYENDLTGSTIKNLSLKSIRNTPIILPKDPKEQYLISKIISDTDELIQQLDYIITKKKNIKQGAMQDLLTGKKRLEGFNKDWDSDIIQNCASITTGSKNAQDRIEEGRFPFFVRSQKVERINSYSYDGEAVLTAGDGDIGKVFHYIKGKFDFHQRVYKISDFDERLDGYFFYLYFSKYFLKRVMSMTAKSTVDSIRMEMIAEMSIHLPEKNEQLAISKILSDIDSEIKELETKKEKYIMIKNGMMQKLLTGEIRLV